MSIHEIAKAAGVSTATVSRVLNGQGGASESTIALVRQKVKELNFVPQRIHRKKHHAIQTKLKTRFIGAITIGHGQTWLQQPVMAAAVSGIQRGVAEHQLQLVLDAMPDLTTLSNAVINRHIDGAIVFIAGLTSAAEIQTVLQRIQNHVPVVWAMGSETLTSGIDHITADNMGIGRLAFSHLKNQNCKKLAFLTDKPHWTFVRTRAQSFCTTAFENGMASTVYALGSDARYLEPYGSRVICKPDFGDLVSQIATSPDRPDGIFIPNDVTTSQVYSILSRFDIKIGKDLKIISCDNEEARISSLHPRPPSIDISTEEIGFRAVSQLLRRIDHPAESPVTTLVASRIVK